MRLLEYLRSIEEEAIAHLRALVNVNSFTLNRDGVVHLAEVCQDMFRPLGFQPRRVRSEHAERGDHLFLTREGVSRDSIMLVSHFDTVYPPEQEIADRFFWREDGGRIYGPGVSDIKGGTVVMWMALRALQELEPEIFRALTLKVIHNASEEGACVDFPRLVREEVTPGTRAALVYEAGYDLGDGVTSIVAARKGGGRFRVRAHGREAHSGNAHDQGANAIREIARIVERIESLTDYERDITFSVGKIDGGTIVNVVPGHAVCDVDMRAWRGEDYRWGQAHILALAGDGSVTSRDGAYTCAVEVQELPGYPPWPPNDESDRLAEMTLACAERLGLPVKVTYRRGGSDGCNLWDLVPTVDGLGPVGRNCHCSVDDPDTGREQESVDRASFVPRALLSCDLIERLVRG